jgi:hypothetical protein
MKDKIQLLASSSSQEGIIECISKFFYSKSIKLDGEDVHNAKGKINGVRVIQKKGRYRFEMFNV